MVGMFFRQLQARDPLLDINNRLKLLQKRGQYFFHHQVKKPNLPIHFLMTIIL